MQNDAWFFVGVFVFIFLIWISTGGPTHPLAFSGPTLALPGALGGGTYLSLPRAPFGVGGSEVSLPGSSAGGGSIGTGVNVLDGVSFGTPSPYRSLVSLTHYVSGAGSTDPNQEYLQLSVSQSAQTPVDLTGWKIESEATGNGVTIPQGTDVPHSGLVNPIQDIVLEPGDTATLLSGFSPIGGSFRENKCIGYYGQFQNFSPTLPQNCPDPKDEISANYGASYIRDASCIEYVDTLSRCQAVLSPPVGLSGSCQSFLLKYLNYNGCVDAHQNDPDFKGTAWRIYLGSNKSLWRQNHELIKLLDKNGDTVDAFSY